MSINNLCYFSVAVTACANTSKAFSDYVVKFSTVISEIGINNIETLKSNGTFVCEIPGWYYISANILTNTGYNYIYINKNSDFIGYSISADTGKADSTSSISVAVELQVKDTVYVFTNAYIYSTFSCLSIVKVT